MGILQKLALKLSPGAEAESRLWCFACPECKAESSHAKVEVTVAKKP
jgi:hypothetical protein